MKIGKNKLRMSSGEVRTFRSETARNNFERVAEAYKHGWKPKHDYSNPQHSHPFSVAPNGKACLICGKSKAQHRIV